MEKRLLIAVVLSLSVLFVWSAITPSPQRIRESTSQPVDIKEDIGLLPAPVASEPPIKPVKPSSEIIVITKTVESDKLIGEFSNIGGSLKKILIKEYNFSLPITNFNSIIGYEDYEFMPDRIDQASVGYYYEDDEYKITKMYNIKQDDYIVQNEIKFENKTDMSKLIDLDIGAFTVDMSRMDNKNGSTERLKERDKSLLEYVTYSDDSILRKNNAFKFSAKEQKQETGIVKWIGFRDRYFCAIVKPLYEAYGYSILPEGSSSLSIEIETKGIMIPPRSSVSFASVIFVGPERLGLLKQYKLEFDKIKKFYRLGLFDVIAKFIYKILHLLYKVIPNWGLCIILISAVIYFSMYPLTIRGMASMKRMQSLQPAITELKEKYKNNPKKMNQEMMELYKKHKINPLGGCLPLLLQMPVFIGLYQVLWRSVSLKGAKFLWIKDLSEADRLFIFPFSMPFIGNELNILPIIMMVVMYFQQKLSAKQMIVTDPNQLVQQKMMGTIMPIFLGAIFYKFASGLTLYFTMFYLFSTFTQFKMSKMTKAA